MRADYTPEHLRPLITLLRDVSLEDATTLVRRWTEHINIIAADVSAEHAYQATSPADEKGWRYLLRQPAASVVGWPWAALTALRSGSAHAPAEIERVVLTSSLPSALRRILGPTATTDFTDMPAALSQVLRYARNQLTLVSPYWDHRAFIGLLRDYCHDERPGLSVLILGPHSPSKDVIELFEEVRRFFGVRGANVRVAVPNNLPRHASESVVHAKVAVADGQYLLIGSANMTRAGLADNLETGVFIEGGLAARVQHFFLSIANVCESK